MNSRRTGGWRAKAWGTAGQIKEGTGRHGSETEKKEEPRNTRADADTSRRTLGAHVAPPKTADTGSIHKYAVVVPVAVVCRLTRRGYDVRHRGARKTPEG